MTDPVADMLTRVRNAVHVRRDQVDIPLSKLKIAIAEVLKREGFIRGFEVTAEGPQGTLRVHLKYGTEGEDVISKIARVSRPGCRVYHSTDQMDPVLGGVGIRIVSTSQGVLSDRECRSKKVGGEVLCEVW
jgi:small subunit ribosomal protein S8